MREASLDPRPPSARKISVIIPAHNEEGYLGRTLAALARQRFRSLEIIVVANGCSDGTVQVAREHCDRLIVLSQRSLGVARNLGARMAKGELLVFLDADTILEPTALGAIAARFSCKDAAGTLKGRPDSDRFVYRLLYALKNFTQRFVVRNGSSGVIICWRKQFMRLGGFDEELEVRENSQLIRRLKQFGRYRYITDSVSVTSMRRYECRGVGRVVWLWTRIWFQSFYQDLRRHQYETVR